MKRYTILSLTVILAVGVWAKPKAGHYNSVDGLQGEALFNAVSSCAGKGYHSLGYKNLEAYYPRVDARADGKVWDMYSDCEFTFEQANCSQSEVCDCWNKEHSIPKSWWGGSLANQGCDLFHLVPTDARVNNIRSNFPYGEVGDTYQKYGTGKLGENVLNGYSGKVFEPADEYKGDLARGYLGTLVKWKLKANSGNGASTFSGNMSASGHYGLTNYGVTLLMKWHRQDPVSKKELDRNDSIEATQGNRNPFIDYPELAEYIWGDRAGQTVSLADLECAYGNCGEDEPENPENPEHPENPENPENPEDEIMPDGDYIRVRFDTTDWTGWYLIVSEKDSVVLDATQNPTVSKPVTIISDTIRSNQENDAVALFFNQGQTGVTIRTTNNAYIQSATGKVKTIVLSPEEKTHTLVYRNDSVLLTNQRKHLTYEDLKFIYSSSCNIALYRKAGEKRTDLQYVGGNTAISVYGDMLRITTDTPVLTEVYDVTGRLYISQRAADTTVSLERGIYILRIGSDIRKIIIR